MHGLFLSAKLSGCQFLPPKLLPLAVPLSCHVTLYFPVHPPADVWWGGGADGGWVGAYRCESRLALTNELSGQTSSEWE